MKHIKLFFPVLLLSLFFAGCSNEANETDEPIDQKEELRFASGIHSSIDTEPVTRGDGEYIAFRPNAALKVIVRDGNETPRFTGDRTTKAVTINKDAASSTLTCKPTPLYWNDLGGVGTKLKLLGIYPYAAGENITNDKISWAGSADQQEAGLDTLDLMFAPMLDYEYGQKANPASLKFEHALTKVSITLKPNSHFTLADFEEAEVVYQNVPIGGDVTITSGEFVESTVVTSPSVIPFQADVEKDPEPESGPETVAYSFTILAVPYGVTTNDIIATVKIGTNTYNVKPLNDRNFNAGEHTNFNVTISKTGINATASMLKWNQVGNIDIDDVGLIGLGEFTIDDADVATKIEEGAIVNMRFTDKGNNPHDAVFEYKIPTGGSTLKWVATTPVYWDDIDRSVTKVEALLVTKPSAVGNYTINSNAEYYFTGSISGQEFSWTDSPTITLGTKANPFFKRPVSKIDITIKTTDDTDKIAIENIKAGSVFIPGCGGLDIKDNVGIGKKDTGNLIITGDHNEGKTEHTCLTAYIYPQTLNELCHVTIGENVYKAELPSDKRTFEAGKHYQFTVTIKKTGASITGSLKDWIDVSGGDIPTELPTEP